MKKCRNAYCAVFSAGIEDMVDQAEYVRGFPRRSGYQGISMIMRQHQGREDMAVARGKAVNIGSIKSRPLKTFVKEILIGIQMGRIGRVHDLKFLERVSQTLPFKPLLDVSLPANNDSLSESISLIGNRCAQNSRIISFGEDHSGLSGTSTSIDGPKDACGRVHPRLQRQLIGIHVHDRSARNAGIHPGFCYGSWYSMDQTRIERRWNDIIASETELSAIGHGNFVGNIFARQLGQGFRTGDFHFVVDGTGVDIQCAAEKVGEAQHIVYLVRIV